MLKVLHVNYSDINGGAAIGVKRLHKSLLKKGIKSSLLVAEKSSREESIFGPTSTFEIIKFLLLKSLSRVIKRLFIKTTNPETFSFNFIKTNILKKINNFDCDIVNLHWIGNEMISIDQINKINKPIVWTFWDMWPFCGAEHYTNNKRFQNGYNKNNKDCAGLDISKLIWNKKKKLSKNIEIICPSQWMYDCVKDSKIMSNFNCNIIKWPIDEKIFFRKDKIISRKKFKLPENRKILIFGSSNGLKDKRKGWYYLKKAIEKTNTSYDLIILGTKRPKNFELKFKGNVFFIDKVNNDIELCNLYNSADSLVLPSINDNTPLISQEAQMCGLPIIAFDHNGISEIVNHKVTGYKAKSLDIISLKDGIDWVFQNLNHANLIKNSLQMSRNTKLKFIGNEYKKLYKNILNK